MRPNILLITTDQQRFDTLHADGNPAIFTPHLDWLGETGTRYTHAYSDCPLCVPARATLMTGLHAWRHGGVKNAETPLLAGRTTLPGLLTSAGYQTRAIGKMHFTPARAHYGFQHMELLPDYQRWVRKQPNAAMPMTHGLGQNEMEPALSNQLEQHTNTYWTAARSVNFLETRDPTKPFFLWASFSKPHPPLDPLLRYWALYDGITLPERRRAGWEAQLEGPLAGFMTSTWQLNGAHRFSPERWRAIRRAYYACITQIDYNLGLIFARLRELDLLSNTWIIFTSDHGEMLGDYGMSAKGTFFDGAARVPLLVRRPDAVQRGGRRDGRLACLADILPTCLDAAGVDFSSECDGLALQGNRTRDVLFGESPFALGALRSDGKKYQFALRGGGELAFDVAQDPMEQQDLMSAGDPAALALRTELIAHLRARQHRTVATGALLPTAPLPDAIAMGRQSWRGFHSRDYPCDVLH